MANVKLLLSEAMAHVTVENWKNAVNHVKNVMIQETEDDFCINQFVDSFVIDLESSDDEEDKSSNV